MPPKITLSKPSKPTGPPKPSKKALTAFTAESSDSEPDTLTTKSSSSSKSKPKKSTSGVSAAKAHVNAQLLAASTSTSTAPPPDMDPSIYDYDHAWESMASHSRVRAAAAAVDAAERKPKYMDALLTAAEVRKRDALRAKERALQREREAEGDEFADKEQFVTEAYKKQQAEIAAAEEAERIREEKERSKSKGMAGFYRNVLDREEKKHEMLVDASATVGEKGKSIEEVPEVKEKSLAELAREKGAEVNEEGAVVDKTQLLSGGLNVSAKPRGSGVAAAATRGGERRATAWQGVGGRREDARARQSRMVEEQLAAAQKRALEAEEEERRNLERAAKSRKTETEVMGARERYLQRKREAEEAKKKGQSA